MIRCYFNGDVLCFEDIHDLIEFMKNNKINLTNCSVGDVNLTIEI